MQYLLKKKKDEDSDADNPVVIEAHQVSTKRPRGKSWIPHIITYG